MDDGDRVTRLGPESGGRPPGRPADARVYSWEWGPDGGRQPGLPWIGIFLLVFGALLLIQQLVPNARGLGSLFVLAIGIAFLVKWALDRGTGSLYAGAIITALGVPGLVEAALAREVDGLGTVALGLAFLFIAAVRAATRGGTGWQAWFGGLLLIVGLAGMITPDFGGLLVPALLVIVGVLLIVPRGALRR